MASAISWMKEQSQLHLILPNNEGTVLPFSTKYSAHATYVNDLEASFGFEHQEASANMHNASQMQVEEAVEEDQQQQLLDEDDLVSQDDEVLEQDSSGPRRPQSKYRYGNPLLGLCSEIPVCDGIAAYTTFVRLWRHSVTQRNAHPQVPVLRLRKWMPFAKCTECCNRRKQMDTEKDADALKVLRDDQRAHINFVKQERLSYRLRQLEGIWSDQYLSLIIDGADQSKHGIPHACSKSHATDAAWKLKLHLMGVIAHGIGAYVFTSPANFAQGNNVTIQALFDVLGQIKKDKGWVNFPPVLYLQLDNTTKQNKGKWLMAFLALLVEAGTFTKIIVRFLPVGHTHEDIDQFFSRISMVLRRRDAHSRLALEKLIRTVRCSKNEWGYVRHVTHWENVANISGWLEGKVHDMGSITGYRQFKFMRCNTSNRTIMLAREWPGQTGSGEYWSGLNKNHSDQPIWKCDDVPNLYADYESVPTASEPDHPPSLETIQKVKEGVQELLKVLHANQADCADTMRALATFSTPASAFPFAWDKDIIQALLGGDDRSWVRGAAAAAAEDEDARLWKATRDCEVNENQFYMLEPQESQRGEPFLVVKVKKRVLIDGVPSARVQFWEPMTELSKPRLERDWYGCKYGCARTNPPSTQIDRLQLIPVATGFTLPLECTVTKGGIMTINSGRNGANHDRMKWYVNLYSANSNQYLEEDEVIPERLRVSGRVDVPVEVPRKRRQKLNNKEADKQPVRKRKKSANNPQTE